MCDDTQLLDYYAAMLQSTGDRIKSKSSVSLQFDIRMQHALNISNGTIHVIHCYAYCRILRIIWRIKHLQSHMQRDII